MVASQNLDELLDQLMRLNSPEALANWQRTHSEELRLPFFQCLKARFVESELLFTHAAQVDQATKLGLMLAEHVDDCPLCEAVALHARGDWAFFFYPQQAIDLYRRALAIFTRAGDQWNSARVNGSLGYVLTMCGAFDEAERAFFAARPEFIERFDKQPEFLLRLDLNYAILLLYRGNYRAAADTNEAVISLSQKHQFPDLIAAALNNRCFALALQGQLQAAEKDLNTARAAALAENNYSDAGCIDMNLGDACVAMGRPLDAWQHYQSAIWFFSKLHNDLQLGTIEYSLGLFFQRIGSWQTALAHYSRALELLRQHNMVVEIQFVLRHTAMLCRETGNYREAAKSLQEAKNICSLMGNEYWLGFVLLEQAKLALDQHRIESVRAIVHELQEMQIVPLLDAELAIVEMDLLFLQKRSNFDKERIRVLQQRSLDFAEARAEHWLARSALISLGRLHQASDQQAAEQLLLRAAAIDDQLRRELTIEELKANFHQLSDDVYRELIRLSLDQQDVGKTLLYTWRLKAAALLELWLAQNTQMVDETAMLEMKQLQQQIGALRWQSAAEIELNPTSAIRERYHSTIYQLERRLQELRLTHDRHHDIPQVALPGSLKSSLGHLSGDALVEYVACGDDLIGIYAERDGYFKTARLADLTSILCEIQELLCGFQVVLAQTPNSRSRFVTENLRLSQPYQERLYDLLIAPILTLASGRQPIRRLVIAPCEPLFSVPFAALKSRAVEEHLGQQFEIEMIRSGAICQLPCPVVSEWSNSVVISASSGNVTKVHDEGRQIAAILGQATHIVDQPVISHLMSLSRPPKIVHIAAHTLHETDSPLFTSIKLGGEVLTVQQAFDLPLRGTQLVTLSGCATSSGLDSGGGLLAFQTAFFVAGAHRSLTSLWPVADEAASAWMREFYLHISQGYSVPAAIKGAQLAMLQDRSLQHPAIWAAFATWRC